MSLDNYNNPVSDRTDNGSDPSENKKFGCPYLGKNHNQLRAYSGKGNTEWIGEEGF